MSLTIHELRATKIALEHSNSCHCENCNTARFAIQREVRHYETAPRYRPSRYSDEYRSYDHAPPGLDSR